MDPVTRKVSAGRKVKNIIAEMKSFIASWKTSLNNVVFAKNDERGLLYEETSIKNWNGVEGLKKISFNLNPSSLYVGTLEIGDQVVPGPERKRKGYERNFSGIMLESLKKNEEIEEILEILKDIPFLDLDIARSILEKALEVNKGERKNKIFLHYSGNVILVGNETPRKEKWLISLLVSKYKLRVKPGLTTLVSYDDLGITGHCYGIPNLDQFRIFLKPIKGLVEELSQNFFVCESFGDFFREIPPEEIMEKIKTVIINKKIIKNWRG